MEIRRRNLNSKARPGLYVPALVWHELYSFTPRFGMCCNRFGGDTILTTVTMCTKSLFMPSESGPFEIPFLDLRLPYQELKAELDSAYERVMQAGRYILGEEVEAFEAEFAAYCGARYCVSVANGLEALYLILKAYGIGKEDEVLVPSNTFIATWLAVSHAGATPVPVEPAPTTFNIDGDSLESCLTPRTRAIIAVHLYGQPAAMDGILRFAREHSSYCH